MKVPPKVVIRADSSQSIGHGHVMRCLTLARALRDRSADVEFISKEDKGDIRNLIEQQGFRLHSLPGVISAAARPAGSDPIWGWQQDVQKTSDIIEAMDGSVDWLIVDHYGLDARWEAAMRGSVEKIMVIDDRADRPHDCDVLLDQNLVADINIRYVGKTPASCCFLLGPRYSLLQQEYAEVRRRVGPRTGPIRRILIFFGGGDRSDLTGLSLDAFLSLKRADVALDIVLAPGSTQVDNIRSRAKGHTNIEVHLGVPSLAPMMARADVSIGACGAATWERLCLGLKCLVVTLADNQLPIAEELDRRGLINWLGHYDAIDKATLSAAIQSLLDAGNDQELSRRCMETVDVNGIDRVCAVLGVTEPTRRSFWNGQMVAKHVKTDPPSKQ